MAYVQPDILRLPNEILDKIFSFLAWSPEESLTPSCPDITSISLSCRRLREAVLPTLFRSVRLNLCWIDGAVAIPGLYSLRQQAPHLAKLIRCVHIQTHYGRAAIAQAQPLTITTAMDCWNTPAGSEIDMALRDRIQGIAAQLFGLTSQGDLSQPGSSETDQAAQIARAFFGLTSSGKCGRREQSQSFSVDSEDANLGEQASPHPSGNGMSGSAADSLARERKRKDRDRRLQLDALLVCMVSLPPQMQSLIFEGVHMGVHDRLQHTFALQVCAMALRIFGNRLHTLTVISRSLDAVRPFGVQDDGSTDDYTATLIPAIPDLRLVTRLTLASTMGLSDRLSRHSLDTIRASAWQVEPLCSNVTHLSLCNLADQRGKIFELIRQFKSLTELTISGVKMVPNPSTGGHVPLPNTDPDDPMWLLFLISVRLHRADLRLHLDNLRQWHAPETLPASAVRWLEVEAVPVWAKVDFERETRLTEDYGSFIPLWTADDSDRGELAREDKGVGKLVDDAFSSRWQTFSNLRY